MLFESVLKRDVNKDSVESSVLTKCKPKAVDLFKRLERLGNKSRCIIGTGRYNN